MPTHTPNAEAEYADEQGSGLIAPDYEQCQAESTPPYGPFSLGPRPKPTRCTSAPHFLAVEIATGPDGIAGAMTLCLACAKQMFEDADLRQRVQLQPITV